MFSASFISPKVGLLGGAPGSTEGLATPEQIDYSWWRQQVWQEGDRLCPGTEMQLQEEEVWSKKG